MNDPEAFTGWFRRPRGRWIPTCCACTDDLCWQLLLDSGDAEHCDKIVLPAGVLPTAKKRGRS